MTIYIICPRFQAPVFKIVNSLHPVTTGESAFLQTLLSIKQRSRIFVNVRMGTLAGLL